MRIAIAAGDDYQLSDLDRMWLRARLHDERASLVLYDSTPTGRAARRIASSMLIPSKRLENGEEIKDADLLFAFPGSEVVQGLAKRYGVTVVRAPEAP